MAVVQGRGRHDIYKHKQVHGGSIWSVCKQRSICLLSIKRSTLESGCLMLMARHKRLEIFLSSFDLILEDQFDLSSNFDVCLLSDVFRDGNTVAHNLARIIPQVFWFFFFGWWGGGAYMDLERPEQVELYVLMEKLSTKHDTAKTIAKVIALHVYKQVNSFLLRNSRRQPILLKSKVNSTITLQSNDTAARIGPPPNTKKRKHPSEFRVVTLAIRLVQLSRHTPQKLVQTKAQ